MRWLWRRGDPCRFHLFAFTLTGRMRIYATMRSKGIAAASKVLVREGEEEEGGVGGQFKETTNQQHIRLQEKGGREIRTLQPGPRGGRQGGRGAGFGPGGVRRRGGGGASGQGGRLELI